MSKSTLQSIKPQYCELIVSGKKTIEVRKTRPKLDVPFKVYIYCTKDKLLTKSHNNGNIYISENKYKSALEKTGNVTLSGKIIGEYVCDEIQEITADNLVALYFNNPANETCLTDLEMRKYANGKNLFLWHISDLKIYDKPKELSEFHKPCKCLDEYEGEVYCDCLNCEDAGDSDYGIIACDRTITRPPQSWCYVEEV